MSPKQKKTIGCIDLFDFDPFHERISLGLLIASEHRNKGFAAEAISLCEKNIALKHCIWTKYTV